MTDTGEADPTEAPRRKRRWGRWLVAFLVLLLPALVVLVVGAILALPWFLTGDDIRARAKVTLEEMLGVEVTIARTDYHPLTGIEMFGIVIGPPPGYARDIARIDRIALR